MAARVTEEVVFTADESIFGASHLILGQIKDKVTVAKPATNLHIANQTTDANALNRYQDACQRLDVTNHKADTNVLKRYQHKFNTLGTAHRITPPPI